MKNITDFRCLYINQSIYISPSPKTNSGKQYTRKIDLNGPNQNKVILLPNLSTDTQYKGSLTNANASILIGDFSQIDEVSSIIIVNGQLFTVDQKSLFKIFADHLPKTIKDATRFPRRASILQNSDNHTEYILYGGEHTISPGLEVLLHDSKISPLDNKPILFNDNVMRFNLENFSWSNDMEEGPWIVDSVNFILEDKLYLIGGYDLKANAFIELSNITYYDLKLSKWNFFILNPFLNETRIGHQVALDGKTVYISGGVSSYSDLYKDYSNSILHLNIKKKELISKYGSNLIQSLFGCSVIHQGRFYHVYKEEIGNKIMDAISIYDMDNQFHSSVKYPAIDRSQNFDYPKNFVTTFILTLFNLFAITLCVIIFLIKFSKRNNWRKNNEFLVTEDVKPIWSDPPIFLETTSIGDLSSTQVFDSEPEDPYSKAFFSNEQDNVFCMTDLPKSHTKSQHKGYDLLSYNTRDSQTRVDTLFCSTGRASQNNEAYNKKY